MQCRYSTDDRLLREVAASLSADTWYAQLSIRLTDARRRTREVRMRDDKRRHTTARREIIPLPSGGLLIDTPGLRELQIWGESDALKGSFEEIENLARQCRFRDCRHEREPGCAVQVALEEGALDSDRWKSYRKLLRELRHLELKQDQVAARLEKEKWKKLMKIPKQSLECR